ncbi:RPM1-interacting protein 4 isoform X2 [Rhodamnia argentea]|uniref:RPM1-interacting protein 4 isoform X2 n=1 Tax=Rhodamnia argentea TaxID=178133 RepID=A0ABM3HQE0_9MYRT|nr:RPM1-interacting protein 4 isoform X2 [Rhodamnia argentea]
MAEHPRVPEFGNWEGGNHIPYTVCFDKARKGRSGTKMINPNDPEENPDLLSDAGAPPEAPASRAEAESEEPKRQGVVRTVHERKMSNDDGSLTRVSNQSIHKNNLGSLHSNESKHQAHGGRGASYSEPQRRPARPSTGGDHSFEKSPMHPQARISGRGSGSPSWEGRGSRESGHAMGTPGRSRLGSAPKGDDFVDKGAAVPKFGEWDENNPASADGYTHIFNQVREERQGGVRMGPDMHTQSPYAGAASGTAGNNSKVLLFLLSMA